MLTPPGTMSIVPAVDPHWKAMFSDFGSVLNRAPSARYMLVRSGTSRLVVLDGRDIRSGVAGRREILRIMRGADEHGGFGGTTMQENKVALVWPGSDAASFRFRFLQVIPESNAVLAMGVLQLGFCSRDARPAR